MMSIPNSFLSSAIQKVRDPGGFQFLFDLLGISIVLCLISWYFHRSDPAWLDVNPSPWLILPMLMGFRYGFKHGVTSAIAGAFCSALLVCMPNWGNIPGLLSENAVHYASFLAVGALSGFARYVITDRTAELESEVAILSDEIKRKDSALSLFRETEVGLKQSLLKHNAEFVSIADQVSVLVSLSDEKGAAQELMNMMQSAFGVLSGALYLKSDSNRLVRSASVSETTSLLPEAIGTSHEMVGLALSTNELVTCRSTWDQHTVDADSSYFAVIPVGGGQGVFVIRRMRLKSISWENLARIEAVLHYWVGSASSRKLVKPENFKQAVRSALNLRDTLGVPGYVVRFALPKGGRDVVSRLEMPGYHSLTGNKLDVIVMDDRNAAQAFVDRVASTFKNPAVKCNIISFESMLGLNG